MSLISLFMMSVLTENIVLTKFLGICPFMGNSNKEKNAIGMGISVMIIVTLSSIITNLLYNYLLIKTDTVYLKSIVFILVISAMVGLLELIIKKHFKKSHESLGLYLPLITTNCAVLGVVLLNINSNYSLIETIIYSVGSSLGFTLVIYVFSSIREYLETKDIPNCFKGYPIAFMVAAIMSLLFGRFV